jgi:hypothetical protein
MIELTKGHFYKDRNNRLALVVSDKIIPLDVFAVLYVPSQPNFHNLFFVKRDGTIDELDPDPMDLIKDVTCQNCKGRGHFLAWVGPDEAAKKPCDKCGSKGYKLLK